MPCSGQQWSKFLSFRCHPSAHLTNQNQYNVLVATAAAASLIGPNQSYENTTEFLDCARERERQREISAHKRTQSNEAVDQIKNKRRNENKTKKTPKYQNRKIIIGIKGTFCVSVIRMLSPAVACQSRRHSVNFDTVDYVFD